MALEVEGLGYAIRYIDNSAIHDGPTVIDADHDRPPVAEVGDFDPAAQRQGRMGGGKVIHIVKFPAGGRFSLEIFSVPGGGPYLISLATGLYRDVPLDRRGDCHWLGRTCDLLGP
jgi:hypothetical protein